MTLARLTHQAYDEAAPAAGIREGAPIRSSEGWIVAYRPGTGDPTGADTTCTC